MCHQLGPVDPTVDGQHLGTLVNGGEDRVGLGHGAELAGKVSLLVGRQRLVPEEDHMVGGPGVADCRDDLGRKRDREVHAADLGPDGGGDGMDTDAGGEGHQQMLPPAPPPQSGPVRRPRLHCRTTDRQHTKGTGMSDDTGAGRGHRPGPTGAITRPGISG